MTAQAKSRGPQKGLVICVSGPSGVGKDSVIEAVLAIRPRMRHSISLTTRPPRTGEQDGRDYHFVSREAFLARLAQGDILEHDCYCDHYYGTPQKPLLEAVARGEDVLLDITVPGSLEVMQKMPDCVTLFILPPSFSELRNRLLKRGTESEDRVNKRLEKARHEITMADRFQYLLINDDLDETARCILKIVDAEHCRYPFLAGIEDEILAR